MPKAYDYKLALTRLIEPTGGPGAELVTLEDAARFVGLMRPWRQARPHWEFAAELILKAAKRATAKVTAAEVATAAKMTSSKASEMPSTSPEMSSAPAEMSAATSTMPSAKGLGIVRKRDRDERDIRHQRDDDLA